MPKRRSTKAPCLLDLLSDDALHLVMFSCDLGSLARLILASEHCANLVLQGLSSGQMLEDLLDLPLGARQHWGRRLEPLRALAVRVTPPQFVSLIQSMLAAHEDWAMEWLMGDLDLSALGKSIRTCREPNLLTTEVVWKLATPFLATLDAKVLESAFWPETIGCEAYDLRCITDAARVPAAEILQLMIDEHAAGLMQAPQIAWLMMNWFGSFVEDSEMSDENAAALGAAAASLRLSPATIIELLSKLDSEALELYFQVGCKTEWALTVLEAWADDAEYTQSWGASETSDFITSYVDFVLHKLAFLTSDLFDFDHASALHLIRTTGTALGKLNVTVPSNTLLNRLSDAEEDFANKVNDLRTSHLDEPLYETDALADSYSAAFLASWATAADFPRAFGADAISALLDCVSMQPRRFQRDISPTLLHWLHLKSQYDGAASLDLVTSFSSAALPRDDLFGVAQRHLVSHAIVVRCDGKLCTGHVASFETGEARAVELLGVVLDPAAGGDGEAVEVVLSAADDAWCWPGYEDELVPPVDGVSQSDVVGHPIMLLCAAPDVRRGAFKSAGRPLSRKCAEDILFVAEHESLLPGVVTAFAVDDDYSVTGLTVKLDVAALGRHAAQVFVDAQSPVWCWPEKEAAFIEPCYGIHASELPGQSIFVKVGNVISQGRVDSFQLGRRDSVYHAMALYVSLPPTRKSEPPGAIVLATSGLIEWRWPGYEHELDVAVDVSD